MTDVCPTSSSIRPSIHYPRTWASDLGMRDGVRGSMYAQGVAGNGEVNPAEGIEEAYDAEDVQPLRTLATPELPSREVIEAHRIDHWPYRSWRDECNEGHCREWGHVGLATSRP